MKTIVFDVPAEIGGALSVLHDYYCSAIKDVQNEYVFVISVPRLEETENIKVIRFPWIKKSWFHRIVFDYLYASRLIRKYQADRVLSLQNVLIPFARVKQSVLVHNALPFSNHFFKPWQNGFLWFYQTIIGGIIKKSIKKADHVFVQTQWMKNAFIKIRGVNPEKIEIKAPTIDFSISGESKETNRRLSTFFYPANGEPYKNHRVIVDACNQLKREGISNYNVVFTIDGSENRNTKKIYRESKNLGIPVKFGGYLPYEKVLQFYSNSILLFPSFCETVGLPLIEAIRHNAPVIVADCEYSREILHGQKRVHFFDHNDSGQLRALMEKFINIESVDPL